MSHDKTVHLKPSTPWIPMRGPQAPSIQTSVVITRDGQRREGSTCRCATCGVEDVCTPRTDFRPRVPGGPLYCRRCI